MKKNILIFIDASLGELDWIVPFMLSHEAKEYEFTLFFRSNLLTSKLIQDYDINQKNIIAYNSQDIFTVKDLFIQYKLPRILKKISKLSFIQQLMHSIQKANQKLLPQRTKKLPNFNYIFRDYNLKISPELSAFIVQNSHAKIIVYPHAVGIQKTVENYNDTLKKVDADLWLENSPKSTRALKHYKDIFLACGAPILNNKYNQPSLFSYQSNTVFIITRAGFNEFASTRELALKAYEKILIFCNANNLNIIVKHHPRDKKLHRYRNIQSKFKNIKEYDGSLINLELQCRICLSFYSTAGIFFTARQIPVFDFTPYLSYSKEIFPHHFYDGNDQTYTHDLITLGIQSKIPDYSIINNKAYLEKQAQKQFKALQKYFPSNANETIAKKLQTLQEN